MLHWLSVLRHGSVAVVVGELVSNVGHLAVAEYDGETRKHLQVAHCQAAVRPWAGV